MDTCLQHELKQECRKLPCSGSAGNIGLGILGFGATVCVSTNDCEGPRSLPKVTTNFQESANSQIWKLWVTGGVGRTCTHTQPHLCVQTNKRMKGTLQRKWSLLTRTEGQKWGSCDPGDLFYCVHNTPLLCPPSSSIPTSATPFSQRAMCISWGAVGTTFYLSQLHHRECPLNQALGKVGQCNFVNEECFTNAKCDTQNVPVLWVICVQGTITPSPWALGSLDFRLLTAGIKMEV